ncbi:S-methyl-5-thioribose-1-phosphate isomerase [Coemansia sp. RSA 2337]|nr:S-methyl-5-thioribose-1-phosphate isomerase [Coemansia sp. S16]KAJ2069996.1 S-methyl-5-thioribose-1-phosphate isomerase [Coemansia sp. S2]KAJ2354389.1 S-methyl-5-thioribose-1-phosphate isomerase [Coemansia sp. RSA 2673]KAJ2460022.1 S-methyl-5-thioribose-1-phosphate isomerase [Coemansia sp. RSA 2337]
MSLSNSASKLQAIRWVRPRLDILDQLLLPHASTYIDISSSADGHRAIATMQTRGAPAIAIVAALSLAAELLGSSHEVEQLDTESAAAAAFIEQRLDYLATSRPTAVNLFDAIRKLKAVVRKAVASGENVVNAYVSAAEAMLAADVADNENIGRLGAEFILGRSPLGNQLKVLTHCNTGALATAGHGTALGIIRSLHNSDESSLDHVYFTETRPYNQGARLTAYELLVEEIPATLVCDSAVSALLRSDPSIRAIVVGADRVARNGDTANKIGTYQLAIAAKFHGRDFIVAAPTTSIDLDLDSGAGIVIEERSQDEVLATEGFSAESVANGTELKRAAVRVAPVGVAAWNPSFDVTPADLITAVVTEKGVFVKADGAKEFDLLQSLSN